MSALDRLRPYRDRILGLIGVLLVVGVVVLSGAVYNQVFTPVVMATVDAERSGLLLEPRQDVTLRGVTVGQIRDISAVGGRARIQIALEPDYTARIPANVTAAIEAPTVFGPKFIDLQMPARPGAPIQAGDVIESNSQVTEINQVFEQLMTLLTHIDPAKLNSTLGAISTTLQGRGENIGNFLVELNDFLRRFNPQLPLLQNDLQRGADVANILDRAGPDILRILDNASVLSDTLRDKNSDLDALFLSFTRLGDQASSTLSVVRPPLRSAVTVLRPTTGLLAAYSSTFPCLLAGTHNLGTRLSQEAGGGPLPGIGIFASFLPAQQGYQYPVDLPKVGATDPPNCRRNPLPPSVTPVPFTKLDDGVTTVDFTRAGGVQPITGTQLAQLLFGPQILPLIGNPSGIAASGIAPTAPVTPGRGGR